METITVQTKNLLPLLQSANKNAVYHVKDSGQRFRVGEQKSLNESIPSPYWEEVHVYND